MSTLEFPLLQSFVQKIKILKFRTKNIRFPYFEDGIWKWYCHIWNQHPWIFLIPKYWEVINMPKFGTKSVFWARILKNCCHIWNQYVRIGAITKFYEETKKPKFGTRNALFGFFWARILKNYCHIQNQHLPISVIANFCEEIKMPKFATKNALCECFWARIFLKTTLSCLKSAPLNLPTSKISWNKENAYILDQKCLIGYFWPRIPYLGIFGKEF